MELMEVETQAKPFIAEPLSDDEAAASFRAVKNLFARWRVLDDEAAILLDVPVRTFRRWKAGDLGRLNRDQRTRLSNLLGIHKALRIIFNEPERGYRWIKADNAALGGRSALEIMLHGELTDIMRVRRYLDSVRGGW